jgi:hypothetical protein
VTSTSPMTASRRFDFHGIGIEMHASHPRVRRALASRFGPFAVRADDMPTMAPDVVVELVHAPACVVAPARGRPIYDTPLGDVVYDDDNDRLVADCGPVVCEAHAHAGRVRITYADECDEQLALAAHPLLTLALLEICKRRGLFSLHAGAVAHGDRAVLLPAPSGSGKSTLALALTLAGFGFIADDMVFLRVHGDAVEVLGFPDELDLSDETLRQFGALSALAGREKWGGRPKHQVRADELGVVPVLRARPALVLFPELNHTPTSQLVDLGATEALLQLAPNVLLTDAASSQAHLDVLALLLAKTPTAKLSVGTDLDAAVATVEGRLP